MGSSNWSDAYYNDREEERARTGKSAFVYNAAVSSGTAARKVHEKMDPKGITRESRDSDAHPNSLPISVYFDVTGSMGGVPVKMQKKLSLLLGLLLRKGYVMDPQILFGAVGDARSDRAPLQVGQFESGIEMDDDLGRIWLEGGGGGSKEESYEHAIYFTARHTVSDAWEKRGKKGFLFLIGDEKPYPTVSQAQIQKIMGDNIQGDIPIADIVRECRERYHVFFILPNETSYFNDPEIESVWSKLLSKENFIKLDNPEGVCEAIATAIGLCEGTVDLDTAKADLKDSGASMTVVSSVASALGGLAKSTALAKVGTGNLPEKSGRSDRVARL